MDCLRFELGDIATLLFVARSLLPFVNEKNFNSLKGLAEEGWGTIMKYLEYASAEAVCVDGWNVLSFGRAWSVGMSTVSYKRISVAEQRGH